MEKERSTLSLQFVSRLGGSPLARTYEAVYASILENRELQSSSSDRSTRHIEVSLPEGATYKEGDHFECRQLIARKYQPNFKTLWIKWEGSVILSASGRSINHIPLDSPVSLLDLLSYSVEVQEAHSSTNTRNGNIHSMSSS